MTDGPKDRHEGSLGIYTSIKNKKFHGFHKLKNLLLGSSSFVLSFLYILLCLFVRMSVIKVSWPSTFWFLRALVLSFFYVLSKDVLCKKCSQIQFVEMIWMFVWGFILLIYTEENFSISYLSLTFCVSHSYFLTHTLSLSLSTYLSIYIYLYLSI